MQLTLDDKTHDVDIAPLKLRAQEGIKALLDNKGGKSDLLRPIVKSGCVFAMSQLGLKKNDRNDDPIEIVTMHIAELIFAGLEANGLVLATVKPEQVGKVKEND